MHKHWHSHAICTILILTVDWATHASACVCLRQQRCPLRWPAMYIHTAAVQQRLHIAAKRQLHHGTPFAAALLSRCAPCTWHVVQHTAHEICTCHVQQCCCTISMTGQPSALAVLSSCISNMHRHCLWHQSKIATKVHTPKSCC